ncbi:hypothetical protein PHLCEN_2v11337 [Hermanssonia centrifuga]|uniref:Uncharacterized protein n=1 Tax=Hermanssonia centrifuga TaxID=98765 RepID=A0A2R6NK60_9APHY|nr:hypothetical protein PHLCEN_2v11337 [Hermanssonia centrifuga]
MASSRGASPEDIQPEILPRDQNERDQRRDQAVRVERMESNPYNCVMPLFSDPAHAVSRQPLIDRGLYNEEAAQSMADSWAIWHADRKACWDKQVEEDDRVARTSNLRLQEQCRRDREKLEAEWNEAERKRPKEPEMDMDAAVGDNLDTRISPFALQKLRSIQHVHLWYFTLDGISSALKEHHSVAEDTMVLTKSEDGVGFKSGSHRASPKAVSDASLSWEQLTECYTEFIKQIKAAGWPKSYMQAHLDLF